MVGISEQGVSRGRVRPRDRMLLVSETSEEDGCVSHVSTQLAKCVEIRAAVVARETRVEYPSVRRVCSKKGAELFSGSWAVFSEELYSIFFPSKRVVVVPV